MKILVTGAGALLGQGIIRSARLAPTPYEIVAVDPDPRSVGLFWADRAHVVPPAKSPAFLAAISRIIAEERPAAVLVGTDIELMVLSAHRAALEAAFDTHVVVSPPEVIRIADDKWLTYEFLRDRGFPHPRSALPEDPAGVRALIDQVGYPLVVKPRVGARSVGVRLVHYERQLREALATVPGAVVQECVGTPRQEYTSGLIAFGGEVRAVVTMRRDLRDGNTYRAYVEPEAPPNPQLVEIARALGGHGPINLQFRLDGGVPKVFEINARFSGTTPLRALAGFNEVDAVIRHVVGGAAVPPPRLRPAVIFRYWNDLVVDAGDLAALERSGVLDGPRWRGEEVGHGALPASAG
jgi:carbamoyl-phosphate synthase large subunit